VLLSLRAATVRQVQQALTVALLVIVIGPILLYAQALSAQQRQQFEAWAATHSTQLGLIIFGVIAAIDLALLVASLLGFRRSRLILS
jgi:uncharacterized membrane protein